MPETAATGTAFDPPATPRPVLADHLPPLGQDPEDPKPDLRVHERAGLTLLSVDAGRVVVPGPIAGLPLPTAPGSAVMPEGADGPAALCLTPHRWLLMLSRPLAEAPLPGLLPTADRAAQRPSAAPGLAPPQGGSALLPDESGQQVSRLAVVDQTHGRCVVRLEGPAARAVVGTVCPFDLSAVRFGPGQCRQAPCLGVPVLLLAAGAETLDLVLPRSRALALWTVLREAALEHGLVGAG